MYRPMADIAVAVHTIEHVFRVARMGVDAVDNLLMTTHAVLLQHLGISRFYHDRFMKILQRETFRMMVAVFGLRHVFADEVVRRMAVVARGDRMMR